MEKRKIRAIEITMAAAFLVLVIVSIILVASRNSGSNEYTTKNVTTTESHTYKETTSTTKEIDYDEDYTSSYSKKEKVKCAVCNGTGHVKYYYGASAEEAYLNGYDDYEYGPCTSCNGTGYTYVTVKDTPEGNAAESGSVVCPSCGKRVSSLQTKKDWAGESRTWCSQCWSNYESIMY